MNKSAYKYLDGKGEHLHTFEDKPLIGTTTLINEIYPPPLAWYGAYMALEYFGWLRPKLKDENGRYYAIPKEKRLSAMSIVVGKLGGLTLEALLELFDEAYKAHDAHKKKAGKAGTDIHAEIERYIINTMICEPSGTIDTTEYPKEIQPFIDWSKKEVKKFLWSEAHIFSTKLWTGGISDFGFIHTSGAVIIGDNKPSIYPKNFIQTAGYGLQAKEHGLFNAKGELLMNVPKIDGYMIYDYKTGKRKYRSDVERLERIFETTVDLYKHKDDTGSDEWI